MEANKRLSALSGHLNPRFISHGEKNQRFLLNELLKVGTVTELRKVSCLCFLINKGSVLTLL